MPHEGKSIMISSFPVYNSEYKDENAEKEMQMIMDAIKGIRNIRNEMNVAPSKSNLYNH